MDINEINVNYLVQNAGLFDDFEYQNNSEFTAKCGSIVIRVSMGATTRDILVRDTESGTRIQFTRIHPKPFETFLDALHWDFED